MEIKGMAAQVSKPSHKVTKDRRPRARLSEEQKQTITDLANSNPNLTHDNIAALNNVERSTVTKLLAREGLIKADIDDFKRNEADLLNALRYRIYASITDDDIKKAPIGTRILGYCQVYDKYRVETGQSTGTQSILVSAISDLKRRKSVDKSGYQPDVRDNVIDTGGE